MEQKATKQFVEKNYVSNWWMIISICCFFLDQLIKNMFVQGLWGEKVVFSWLRFSLQFNEGLAFGLLKGYGLIISLMGIIIFLYFLFANYKWWQSQIYSNIGVGLVLAGAISNVTDRFRYNGQVADYINVSFYSIFNLADVFVVLGLLLLVWMFWREESVKVNSD